MDKEKTRQLAKGAGIIFSGIFITYIIKFIYRIIASRYLGAEGYGLLSFGEMVMGLGYMFALIGLDVGLMHHLAFYREKKDLSRLRGSFLGTLFISTTLSVLIIALLIFFSEFIAVKLFKNPEFVPVLIVFSIAIIFSVFGRIISQTLLSFKRQVYDVFVKVFARDFLFLLLTVGVVFLGGEVFHVAFVYLVSLIFSAFVGFLLLEKKVFSFFKPGQKILFEYKERVSFAFPLFLSAVILSIMGWLDTLMLGIFRSTAEVGIYNVALPLAVSLGIFLSAFAPIFYPLIAEMIAAGRKNEVRRIYSQKIHWMFMFSAPIFLLLIFFPETIIRFVFGEEYVAGSLALVILSSAYFVNVSVGLTFETLVCFNKRRLIFWLNAFALLLNVLLNLVLIPNYGITGAAIATGSTIVIRELLSFYVVKKTIRLKLLSNALAYLKILLALAFSFSITLGLFSLLRSFLSSYFLVAFLLLSLGSSYLLFLLLFGAVNKEDYLVFNGVAKKLGFTLTKIERFFQ